MDQAQETKSSGSQLVYDKDNLANQIQQIMGTEVGLPGPPSTKADGMISSGFMDSVIPPPEPTLGLGQNAVDGINNGLAMNIQAPSLFANPCQTPVYQQNPLMQQTQMLRDNSEPYFEDKPGLSVTKQLWRKALVMAKGIIEQTGEESNPEYPSILYDYARDCFAVMLQNKGKAGITPVKKALSNPEPACNRQWATPKYLPSPGSADSRPIFNRRYHSSDFITLAQLGKAIPISLVATLRKVITPLTSGYDTMPAIRDMQTFWADVEEMLAGLGDEIKVEKFNHRHIRNLSPYILGPLHTKYRDTQFADWEAFKRHFTYRYGISKDEMKQSFFRTRIEPGENVFDFINRIESFRIQHGISEQECKLVFMPQFPADFQNVLNSMASHKVMRSIQDVSSVNLDMDRTDFTWGEIAEFAARARPGTRLRTSEDSMVVGFGPKRIEQPPVGQIGLISTRRTSHVKSSKLNPLHQPQTQKADQVHFIGAVKEREDRACMICKPLDIPSWDTHNTDMCFGNPSNPRCKHITFAARFKAARDKGLHIPELFPTLPQAGEKLPPPPEKDHKKEEMNLQAFIKDLELVSDMEGLDPAQAAKDLLESHMGNVPTSLGVSPPDLQMMIREREPEAQDFVAVTQSQQENRTNTWKEHISQLNTKSVPELMESIKQVAQAGADLQAITGTDEQMEGGDENDRLVGSDEGHSSYNHPSDMIPMAQLIQHNTPAPEGQQLGNDFAGTQIMHGQQGPFMTISNPVASPLGSFPPPSQGGRASGQNPMQFAAHSGMRNISQSQAQLPPRQPSVAQDVGEDELRGHLANILGSVLAEKVTAKKSKKATKAVIPSHQKPNNQVQGAMKKFTVQIPLEEAIDYKRPLYDALNMMVIGSAQRCGRKIQTLRGVQTVTLTKEEYDQKSLEIQQQTIRDMPSILDSLHTSTNPSQARSAPVDQQSLTLEQSQNLRHLLSRLSEEQVAEMLEDVTNIRPTSIPGAPPPMLPTITEVPPDGIYHSLDSDMVRAPTGLALPGWVSTSVRNCRGVVPPSTGHYMAIVQVQQGVCEAILDTGAARTMVDQTTAAQLGLEVELATPQKNFGSFWGPSGPEALYYGRIKGPVYLNMGPGIYLVAHEIKVIKQMEPLLLVGTDVLCDSNNPWKFHSIGIHPDSRVGVLRVVNQQGQGKDIELARWPSPVNPATGDRMGPGFKLCERQLMRDLTGLVMLHKGPRLRTSKSQKRQQLTTWLVSEVTRASAFKFPSAFDDIIYGVQMTDFGEKEKGWQDWLKKYQLWDECVSEDQAYLRYLKLHKIKFEALPEDQWHYKFWDLLQFEPALVFGDSIGLCEQFPFRFEVSDPSPLIMKPMPYAKEQREFIRQHTAEQCSLGVMREIIKGTEKDPLFVTNAVLVKGGQSQTDYRFCGNFVQPNTRIRASAHPMTDCKSGLDGMQGCVILCGIDVKAAFNNCWVPEALQTYLGIVTQDGLFVYTRMPFGINAAPAMFQHAITQLLDKPTKDGTPRPAHSTYLDDVGIGRPEGLEETWADALYAIKRLTWGGMPLNIWKCQFLVTNLTMLGMTLWNNSIVLGVKAMKKFLGSEIPTTLKELQGLMGRLNFASSFVPDYRRLVQPILNLMNKRSDGVWTEEHTSTLNQLASLIHQRIRLGLCDMSQPARIHVDVNDTHCSGVMTQGEGESFKVIAFMGRWLLPTEQKCCRMEKLLIASLWVLKRLGRYTHYLPGITIVFPHPAEVSITSKGDLPVRLQVQLIELTSFACSFACGEGAWGLQNQVAATEVLQLCEPNVAEQNPTPDLRVWMHKEVTLQLPCNSMGASREDIQGAYVMHYDGGCSKKEGTGGYVVWDSNGKCVGGGYKFYGSNRSTNNQAEAQSLVDGLSWIVNNCSLPKKLILVARGDSNLITQFMSGGAKPGNKVLVEKVKEAKLTSKQCKKVHYQHVPREENKWADWLTRVAKTKQKDGEITQPDLVQGDPPDSFEADFVSMTRESSTCAQCGQSLLQPGIACWGCDRVFHRSCLGVHKYGPGIPTRPGPWHCRVCIITHQLKGTRDITLDDTLLRYLAVGEKPSDPREVARVIRAGNFLRMDQSGNLFVQGPEAPEKLIPPMKDRMKIIKEIAVAFAFPNGRRLHDLLKQQYYWDGMQADSIAVCAEMLPRQIEGAKFKQPPYLHPTEKGAAPFRIWCIDSIGPFKPPAPDGADHIIIAVDPFTKWVEAGTVPNKNSFETAAWFHKEIVCRYGLPSVVRSDRGTEYAGMFDGYLKGQGITHRRIATMNPRANGQVERLVAVVKSGIRKISSHVPGSKWWENLPDVLRGQRCLATRATGYSPYLLVFKTPPILPLSNALIPVEQEDFTDMGPDIERVAQYWDSVYKEVVARQFGYDSKMKQQYLEKENLAQLDVRFVFAPGDPVLLKQRVPGKMQCKAMGPYVFDKYVGPLKVNAIILDKKFQEIRVSVGNLLPMDMSGGKRSERYNVPDQLEVEDRVQTRRRAIVQNVLLQNSSQFDTNEISESYEVQEMEQSQPILPQGVVLMDHNHLKRFKQLQQQDFVKKVRAGPSAFDSSESQGS